MFRMFGLGLVPALIVGSVFLPSAVAQDPAKNTQMSKTEIIEDIERTLDDSTTMEFTDTPLSDVIDYLRDLHKTKHPNFEILLDTKVLGELGITSDTPMTKNVKGISLRSALRTLLRDLGLTYVIRNEVLMITSPENACYTKVYDVADLVSSKGGQNQTALDSLMKMVVKTCPASAPEGKSGWPGWVASLNSADVDAIVVHQPEDIQDEVLELFTKLRHVRHTK